MAEDQPSWWQEGPPAPDPCARYGRVIEVVVDQIEDEDFRVGKPKLYVLVEWLDGSREHVSFERIVEEDWRGVPGN
jgi:hypothetical protein